MVQIVAKTRSARARMLQPRELRTILEPVRWRILAALSKEPSYASLLARKLGLNEQLVHYHFNALKKTGVISVIKTSRTRGALTRFFGLNDKAFAVTLKDAWEEGSFPEFLKPFFVDGSFDGKIVVGSPDPHGPNQARARDAFYAVDLSLFLGSLSATSKPSVRLDTEVREKELKENNLILIGGPIVNLITAQINSSLPIRITTTGSPQVFSSITKKKYQEDVGIVVKMQSPFNPLKTVLVLAGLSIGGTKASILAVTNLVDNLHKAHVVKGLDLDGDGIVDTAELVE